MCKTATLESTSSENKNNDKNGDDVVSSSKQQDNLPAPSKLNFDSSSSKDSMDDSSSRTISSSSSDSSVVDVAAEKANKSSASSSSASSLWSFSSLYWTKDSYKQIADEFHSFHQHDGNVFLHLFTTCFGIWGAIQLAVLVDQAVYVYAYMGLVVLTCPYVSTCIVHTGIILLCTHVELPIMSLTNGWLYLLSFLSQHNNDDTDECLFLGVQEWNCLMAIAVGYGLQDVVHYVTGEKTYLNDYIFTRPYMLLIHSFWLLPLVIDSMTMRAWFFPHFFVHTNRCVVCNVSSIKAVDQLRKWLQENVEETPLTTHLWPHQNEGTTGQVTALEQDESIMKQFRTVFPAKHYDILAIQDMNEIYVTAVGAKKEINSDAVFYTKHNDGPYWWLPMCSLYRVLVGVTPNTMVRTNFNLQHPQEAQVLDIYGAVGFDYNRELHYIDHVPGQSNSSRRSLIKLHYIVYPKGWHSIGRFAAKLNTNYNTWARNNFLQTLTCDTTYDWVMAWWIWLTTIINATLEEHVGWPNVVYVGVCYWLGQVLEGKPGYSSTLFFILTSYRHYFLYIATFACRNSQPKVAQGFFIRDALFYKTCALIHLGTMLFPLVDFSLRSMVALVTAVAGYSITMLATHRLGKSRTYFGFELGYEPPKWITGFPYGYIPHPMIVGQLIAFSGLLYGLGSKMDAFTKGAVAAHMTFYAVHMVQEIVSSSYYQ